MTEKPADKGTLRNPFQGVIAALFIGSLLGLALAIVGGIRLVNPVLLATGLTLAISCGILAGVGVAQASRYRIAPWPEDAQDTNGYESWEDQEESEHEEEPEDQDERESAEESIIAVSAKASALPKRDRTWKPRIDFKTAEAIGTGTAVFGILGVLVLIASNITPYSLSPVVASIATIISLAAAAMAFSIVGYFQGADADQFPEAAGLSRLARVMGWVLVVAGMSMICAWLTPHKVLTVLFYLVLVFDVFLSVNLFIAAQSADASEKKFPLDLAVISLLGSRTNPLASILDAAERQLGIDLRSTWALKVVRRSVEPLIVTLLFLAWISTSLTVIGPHEQGLVERLGVPLRKELLWPGLHMHWPWPVDRIIRVPVLRVQSLTVGHEMEERTGPEDVLWAVQHAANEYTLLLGNGRDLITIDAAVQFRIQDARRWIYNTSNPADALRAIAYRAVMRSTVNRTLEEALSENMVKLTAKMGQMVQQDADRLGLGVQVVAFTVGGMHPPVMVASDYQAVVSAEVGKVTSIVNAQVFHNQTVPAAEASAFTSENAARAEGTEALARAEGEAWSFRTIAAQYKAAQGEYFFRRRLEALEQTLGGRRFTIVDSRIQRDGGELWLMP